MKKTNHPAALKKLYIKSTWPPPRAFSTIEKRLNAFESKILHFKNNIRANQNASTNLDKQQLHCLRFLKNNNDIIVLMADKNLGPAIMEKQKYVNAILQQHLLDKSTYKLLNDHNSTSLSSSMTEAFIKLIFTTYRHYISPFEIKYFQHHMKFSQRVPVFYGTPKIHKEELPIPFRPIISQCGSLSAAISTYLDAKLQPLTNYMTAYIKNSTSVIHKLKKLKTLPPNSFICTCDAVSMYTNIHNKEG